MTRVVHAPPRVCTGKPDEHFRSYNIGLMHAREAQTADLPSVSPATANIGTLMCAIFFLLGVPCIRFLIKLYYVGQEFRLLRRQRVAHFSTSAFRTRSSRN